MTTNPDPEPAPDGLLKPGRPSKLTPAVHTKVVDALRAGDFLEVAARFAGISDSTVRRWVAEGEADDAPPDKAAFAEAVHHARAEVETRVVSSIVRAAVGGIVTRDVTRTLPTGVVERDQTLTAPDTKAGLEFLARAFPLRWSRRSALELSGPGGAALEMASPERMTSLVQRVEAALGQAVTDAELINEEDL